MPRREESNFRALWILGRDSLPATVREYLQECPHGSLGDNEQMLSSFLDRNERFVEFWVRTPVADFINAFGIPCEKSFGNPESLPEGFWIVKVQSDSFNHVAAPVAVFPWAEWMAVRDALCLRTPFKWSWTYHRQKTEGLYLFGSSLWSLTKTDAGFPPDHLPLVFREVFEREKKKDERRMALFGPDPVKTTAPNRQRIPDRIRNIVWERDNGRCAKCGATSNLQFDHIIPVSKGGGQNAENLELLCDLCNQAKGSELS